MLFQPIVDFQAELRYRFSLIRRRPALKESGETRFFELE
jgi:hypothetical protein